MRWIYFVFLVLLASLEAAPDFVYLCLAGDPSKTMAVQWTGAGDSLQFGAIECIPEEQVIAGSQGKILKRVILQGLQPDHEYSMTIDGQPYRFKTLPESLGKVRFVVGGDVYHDYEKFRRMNEMVAKLSPDFVILGGDIAYAFDFRPFFKKVEVQWKKWQTFFQCWCEQMRDEKGRLIPMVVTTGNHDTKGRYLELLRGETSVPSLFYTFFPFEQAFVPYQKIVIANALALVLLDSGHTHAISGEQTAWLRDTLKEAKELPYKMAVYHVPAYPSNRTFKGKNPTLIRKNWSPLFQRYGVQVAFEHHNHAYKRTRPQSGVMYLGDGSWGVKARRVKTPRQRTYLEKSEPINAVLFVTLEKDCCQIFALDIHGHVIDKVPEIKPAGTQSLPSVTQNCTERATR